MAQQFHLYRHRSEPMRVGEAIGRARDLFLSWRRNLNKLDLAMRQGKAVEQITEALIVLPGVEEINVDDSGHQNGEPVVAITTVGREGLTREIQHVIRMKVAEMNRRYGTIVRVRISNH